MKGIPYIMAFIATIAFVYFSRRLFYALDATGRYSFIDNLVFCKKCICFNRKHINKYVIESFLKKQHLYRSRRGMVFFSATLGSHCIKVEVQMDENRVCFIFSDAEYQLKLQERNKKKIVEKINRLVVDVERLMIEEMGAERVECEMNCNTRSRKKSTGSQFINS